LSGDEAFEQILKQVTRECRLQPAEIPSAARAVRFYKGEMDLELTWGDSPNERQLQIESSVVAAVRSHYGLDQPDAPPPFNTARITAQRLRASITPQATHRVGNRRPASMRASGGGLHKKRRR
jgi:hypothetical protein